MPRKLSNVSGAGESNYSNPCRRSGFIIGHRGFGGLHELRELKIGTNPDELLFETEMSRDTLVFGVLDRNLIDTCYLRDSHKTGKTRTAELQSV